MCVCVLLFVCLFVCLFDCLFVCLCVCLFVCLFVCMYVYVYFVYVCGNERSQKLLRNHNAYIVSNHKLFSHYIVNPLTMINNHPLGPQLLLVPVNLYRKHINHTCQCCEA